MIGGHGDVLPNLSEYTSRQCRMKLAQVCLTAAASPDMGLSDPNGYIAGQLNVTKRTVRRWKGGGIQSCNVNADKLIELAYRLNPEDTDQVLREDLELHRITYLNGQGAVRSKRVHRRPAQRHQTHRQTVERRRHPELQRKRRQTHRTRLPPRPRGHRPGIT